MAMRPREYRVMFEIEEDYWWYQGLRALLLELLARYAPDRRTRILDAGCGTGANLQLLLEHGDAVGVDIAAEAVEFCRAAASRPTARCSPRSSSCPFRQFL